MRCLHAADVLYYLGAEGNGVEKELFEIARIRRCFRTVQYSCHELTRSLDIALGLVVYVACDM